MAILIPSKNIYDKQNPKVRDNVIERMEVSAVEIVPDNKYEEPVANIVEYKKPTKGETQTDIIGDLAIIASPSYNNAISYVEGTPYYYNINIKIPLIKENSYIRSLLLGVDDNNNANIKYTTYGVLKTGNVSAILTRDGIDEKDVRISDIVKSKPTEKQSAFTDIPYKYSNTVKYGGVAATATATAEISFDEGNIKTIKEANIITENEKEYYTFQLTVLGIVDIITAGASGPYGYTSSTKTENYEALGTYKEHIIEKIEVTVYGNTIGIDLVDKTIYIPNTDTTSKKVFSVDGNELMQTNVIEQYQTEIVSNIVNAGTLQDTDGYYRASTTFTVDGEITSVENTSLNPAITTFEGNTATIVAKTLLSGAPVVLSANITYKKAYQKVVGNFEETLALYLRGKETATIRCSISDYYDYEKGEKVIAIDNSTNKMSFKIGDQVIPMVYSANGQDKPMSLYQDGSPKVFQVLGTKIYYDGAVWQELSLQEA